MIPNVDDRLMATIRAIIRDQFPRFIYSGVFQYSIKSVTGSAPSVKLDCEPTDQSIGLPPLVGIAYQPSVSGITGTPSVGMMCAVVFLNQDPTLPRIIGVDSLGSNPVARLGDQVTAFLPPSLPVQGTVSGNPFFGVITIASPITGIINQGSGKVVTG